MPVRAVFIGVVLGLGLTGLISVFERTPDGGDASSPVQLALRSNR